MDTGMRLQVGMTRRELLSAIVGSSLVGMAGCGPDKAAIELNEDVLLRREQAAIAALKEQGCRVEETEDEILGSSGIMVTFFPEHFSEQGVLITDLLSRLRDLRKVFLIIDGTPISPQGLAEFRSLNNLLLMSVQRTRLNEAGLVQIEGIVSLRLLRLGRTRITDQSLRHIVRLPNLVMLYLSHTALTDEAVKHLVSLKKLRALKLSGTKITDEGVAGLAVLTDMEFLGLNETGISDGSIKSLKSLKKLKHLDLSGTKVTLDGVRELKDALPDCFVAQELTLEANAGESLRSRV